MSTMIWRYSLQQPYTTVCHNWRTDILLIPHPAQWTLWFDVTYLSVRPRLFVMAEVQTFSLYPNQPNWLWNIYVTYFSNHPWVSFMTEVQTFSLYPIRPNGHCDIDVTYFSNCPLLSVMTEVQTFFLYPIQPNERYDTDVTFFSNHPRLSVMTQVQTFSYIPRIAQLAVWFWRYLPQRSSTSVCHGWSADIPPCTPSSPMDTVIWSVQWELKEKWKFKSA